MKRFTKRVLLICFFHGFLYCTAYTQIKLEWFKHFGALNAGSTISAMVIDSNKSIFICGYFSNTVDMDPGPGVTNLTSNGGTDVYIAEYDTGGNFLWVKTIGGTSFENAAGIKVDRAGNIYVAGLFQTTVDMDPGPGVVNFTVTSASSFLLKLDNNGNFIWAKQFSTGNLTFLCTDTNDDIVIGGYFGGSVDFDPGPGVFNATANLFNAEDFFVVKLDRNANFLWMRQLRNLGGGLLQTWSATTDLHDNIYFAGNFPTSIDFDPGPGTLSLTSMGSDDTFIFKLDAQGNFSWVKQFGGTGSDKIWDVVTDSHGNVYTTGQFADIVDFDPGPGSFPLTAPNPSRSCFISKLDMNGNFIYGKNLQAGEAFGQSITIDIDDNLYVAGGYTYNTVDLDPGPGIYIVDTGNRFTLKLDPAGNFLWGAPYITRILGSFESVWSDLAVDALKNVYYTGVFPFAVDWDPTQASYVVVPNGTSDGYIHKLSQCNNSLSLITAQTCTSYTLNGVTYNSSGNYYQTVPNSVGCDSIIQLFLTLGNITHQESVTACNSYTFNGNVLTATGNYAASFPLSNGCDSIVNLNLTINTIIPPQLGTTAGLCTGDTLLLSAGNYTGYLWNDGSTSPNLNVYAPGEYSVMVTGANACTAADTVKVIASGECGGCSLSAETKLYPNPFSDILILKKNATDCVVKMNVYNSLGQLMLRDQMLQDGDNYLPFKNFANGVYFYRLHSNGKILQTGRIEKRSK